MGKPKITEIENNNNKNNKSFFLKSEECKNRLHAENNYDKKG